MDPALYYIALIILLKGIKKGNKEGRDGARTKRYASPGLYQFIYKEINIL